MRVATAVVTMWVTGAFRGEGGQTRRRGLVVLGAAPRGFGKEGGVAKATTPKKAKKKKQAEAAAAKKRDGAAKVLVASKARYAERIALVADKIATSLAAGEVAIVDELLGVGECTSLRSEAAAVHAAFVREEASAAYAESGIDRTRAELMSPEDLDRAPRTVGLMLALTGLSDSLGAERGASLSTDPSANMLSCYLKGGAFPPHLDNHGGEDRRLIGMIYYLNPRYDPVTGGRFVPWRDDQPCVGLEPIGDASIPGIEPRGDRLIAFYCDTLEHSVQEFSPAADYFRYALTVWLMDDGDRALLPDRRTKSPTEAHRRLRDALAADPPSDGV